MTNFKCGKRNPAGLTAAASAAMLTAVLAAVFAVLMLLTAEDAFASERTVSGTVKASDLAADGVDSIVISGDTALDMDAAITLKSIKRATPPYGEYEKISLTISGEEELKVFDDVDANLIELPYTDFIVDGGKVFIRNQSDGINANGMDISSGTVDIKDQASFRVKGAGVKVYDTVNDRINSFFNVTDSTAQFEAVNDSVWDPIAFLYTQNAPVTFRGSEITFGAENNMNVEDGVLSIIDSDFQWFEAEGDRSWGYIRAAGFVLRDSTFVGGALSIYGSEDCEISGSTLNADYIEIESGSGGPVDFRDSTIELLSTSDAIYSGDRDVNFYNCTLTIAPKDDQGYCNGFYLSGGNCLIEDSKVSIKAKSPVYVEQNLTLKGDTDLFCESTEPGLEAIYAGGGYDVVYTMEIEEPLHVFVPEHGVIRQNEGDPNGRFFVFDKEGNIASKVHIHAAETEELIENEIPATCVSEGSYDRTVFCCYEHEDGSKCHAEVSTEHVVVPTSGHTWGDWQVTTLATCEEAGSESRTCSVCGETETREIPSPGHIWTFEYEIDIPPTCTEDGLMSVHCANCDKTILKLPVPAKGHTWDAGKVTKEPTVTATGIKTYTCQECGKTRTETLPKISASDAVAPGADEKAADAAIINSKVEEMPGASFGVLRARSIKTTKKSVKLQWTKVPGAAKYVIYGNRCGLTRKYKKLMTVKGKIYKIFKKVKGKKVKKGTYYKFLVVAVNKKGKVISTSKTVHVATKGGKVGNDKKVKTAAKKNKVTLKVGKTFKLKAKSVPQSKKLKVRRHRKILFESSKKTVARVNNKGVIRAKKKGTCFVYAYTQNGIFAKIKVTVK